MLLVSDGEAVAISMICNRIDSYDKKLLVEKRPGVRKDLEKIREAYIDCLVLTLQDLICLSNVGKGMPYIHNAIAHMFCTRYTTRAAVLEAKGEKVNYLDVLTEILKEYNLL